MVLSSQSAVMRSTLRSQNILRSSLPMLVEVRFCNFLYSSVSVLNSCDSPTNPKTVGSFWAMLYAKMSEATNDMQAWCYFQFETCNLPKLIEIDESKFFTPKPEAASIAPKPSGETFNVLHLSDCKRLQVSS